VVNIAKLPEAQYTLRCRLPPLGSMAGPGAVSLVVNGEPQLEGC
jgi:hypothetical protein